MRIKQKDICHFPELVILHSLLFMWMTGGREGMVFVLFFLFSFIFLEEGDPRALPAAMVLYVRGKKVVLLMNWTSFFGPHDTNSRRRRRHPLLFLHPAARVW